MDLQWEISKLTINKITNASRKIYFIIFTCIFNSDFKRQSWIEFTCAPTTYYNLGQHLVGTLKAPSTYLLFVRKCTQHLSSHLNKTHYATTIHNNHLQQPPRCSLSHIKSLSSISLSKKNEDKKFSFTNKHSQKIYRTMGIKQVL